MVTVNNKPAKPGKTVNPHDIIRIDFLRRVLEVEIIELPEGNVRKTEASHCYSILRDEKVDIRS